jgi:hypothetical protein
VTVQLSTAAIDSLSYIVTMPKKKFTDSGNHIRALFLKKWTNR